MDPNLLKNLNLNSSINENDLELLTKILGSNGNKMPKITAKERNNLINKLSTANVIDNVPEKAIPTAKPAAPKSATKEVISIPNWVTPVTNTKILNAIVVKLVKKVTRPSSI